MIKKYMIISSMLITITFVAAVFLTFIPSIGGKSEIEEIPYSDTISVYTGITGIYEIPLTNLTEDQHVHVYLQVNQGSVKIDLYDRIGHKILPQTKNRMNMIDYAITYDGDYKLRIDAHSANFCLSVLKMDNVY